MSGEWVGIRKGAVRLISRYCSGIDMERLTKLAKTLRQHTHHTNLRQGTEDVNCDLSSQNVWATITV